MKEECGQNLVISAEVEMQENSEVFSREGELSVEA